jgi:hypothetical protein
MQEAKIYSNPGRERIRRKEMVQEEEKQAKAKLGSHIGRGARVGQF